MKNRKVEATVRPGNEALTEAENKAGS